MIKPTLKVVSESVKLSKGTKDSKVMSTNEWSSYDKLGKESSEKSAKVALQIYHQNIQGLRSKIDELLNFLHPEYPHILCLSEHHFKQLELEIVQLGHYTLGASYCRHLKKKTEVSVFMHTEI